MKNTEQFYVAAKPLDFYSGYTSFDSAPVNGYSKYVFCDVLQVLQER